MRKTRTEEATNPFQIGIGYNEPMKCWDLQVLIGNMKSREEAQKMADLLVEWIKDGSLSAWSQRVS
jgi:hypothetical protein